jgi:hypothetical protein
VTAPGGPGVTDLVELLASLDPQLDDTAYVVIIGPHGLDPTALAPLATVIEDEGTTVVVPAQHLAEALALGCTPEDPPPMARITLRVHSSLLAVGLTAAVSGALAAEGISCNVLAGYHHDHLLVPVERADDSLAVLRRLQADARP